jgi:hypothetical protein
MIGLLAAPVQAQPVCVTFPWSAAEADPAIAALVRWVAPTLADAPAMAASLAQVAPDLCLSPQVDGAQGYLDPLRQQIVLDVRAAPDLQRGILLHELRHLEQFARGYCPANDLALQDNARATFAVEADASAVSLLLAWQRRGGGDASAWNALAAWPQQADIAARFAAEIGSGADLPAAAAAAFAQWYALPERRDAYYQASCSDYFDREDQGNLLRGSARLPADFLTVLCILPDGRPYPCVEPGSGAP